MRVVIDRLPQPAGARLSADRVTGTDERQKGGRNHQVFCSHFVFSEPQIAFVIDPTVSNGRELKQPTPIRQAGFPF
jgi:hypothetical protein